MNITFVTLGFNPFRTSGLDISGERLVSCLLDDGHQVTVVAAGQKDLVEVTSHPSMRIIRLRFGKLDWFGYSLLVSRVISKLPPTDVLHFWDVHFAIGIKKPYVASLHQSFNQRANNILSVTKKNKNNLRHLYYFLAKNIIEVPSINKARGLLAVSNSTRNEFIQSYKVPSKKIALARHGINTEFFRKRNNCRSLRQKWGIDDKEKVIMFSGFITPRKGVEYLLMALPKIKPIPRLVIVGLWRSEKYREQVLRLLGPYRDRIIETGYLQDELMPDYYSMADLYVSTSLLEGFGLPLAEAIACQTPVVAMDAGAVAEVVGPGGLVLTTKDVKLLADTISALFIDPDLIEKMGIRGREYIEDEFSYKAMVNNHLAAYARFL